MKIIEYTYPDCSHSYSTGGATLLVDGIEPIGSEEYEVDDVLGMNFLEDITQYTFEKGVINAKS